ncbi:hypothetical protein AB0952_27225 [Streptomyces caniferus]|uniref:hypothetical protein n=1 Tax=Streptomyces caniferus TaxID=285557 RepID=UPI00345335FD
MEAKKGSGPVTELTGEHLTASQINPPGLPRDGQLTGTRSTPARRHAPRGAAGPGTALPAALSAGEWNRSVR